MVKPATSIIVVINGPDVTYSVNKKGSQGSVNEYPNNVSEDKIHIVQGAGLNFLV